ncbi:MAG: flavin reductase family protein [Gemmatimonadaceae bacterium]
MDPDIKKRVLRNVVYGLYALGVRHEGVAHAMTLNWMTQVSFEPPMIAVAIEKESRTLPMVQAARAFAISIFPTGARQLAGRLGRHSRNVPDKLDGVAHRPASVSGAPILDEATGWLDCRVDQEVDAGDHVLVIAEVVDVGVGSVEAETLTLKETGFRYAG